MGIYIAGMKMPTVGRILIIFPSGRTLEVSADNTQNILGEAQAIPVPPHGDLIDRDALTSKRKTVLTGMGSTSFATEAVLISDIKNAPTIYEEEVYDKYTDTAGNLHWTGTHSGAHTIKAEEGKI